MHIYIYAQILYGVHALDVNMVIASVFSFVSSIGRSTAVCIQIRSSKGQIRRSRVPFHPFFGRDAGVVQLPIFRQKSGRARPFMITVPRAVQMTQLTVDNKASHSIFNENENDKFNVREVHARTESYSCLTYIPCCSCGTSSSSDNNSSIVRVRSQRSIISGVRRHRAFLISRRA